MALFGWPLEPGDDYLYHYTSPSTLAIILDGGSLRLGPYAATRDPRENMQWFSGFSAGEGVDIRPEAWDIFAVSQTVDAAIRQRTKLACLTLDRPASMPWSGEHARGYGRARMWEQYADRHQGAVLIFDRQALDTSVTEELVDHDYLFMGPVQYSDEAVDIARALHFRVEETLAPETLTAAADAVIAKHGETLFFGKNMDWLTESEYRYVVVSDSPAEFVPIKSSLRAIVVGMDYPDHEASVLRVRLERLGLPALHVARCYWRNGQPTAGPTGI